MKIFLVFALLVVSTIITTATTQLDPSIHVQERPQQSFPQQQPLTQQQPFPPQEPQQPLFQQQQPYPQQSLPQQQLPQQHLFPQQLPQQQFPQQMPLPHQQQIFPQQQQPPQQQPFYQYQQPLTQQPYPQEQPLPQQQPSVEENQQLNLCKEFLLQQCNPEEKLSLLQSVIPFLRPKTSQQNNCQLKRQQCCRQLAHISEPSRCPAIHNIVHAIIMQQQQQQQQHHVDRGFVQPQPQQLGQGMPMQPQHQLGQGLSLPQQLAQFKLVRLLVIQTLPMLCNVHVPSDCYTISAPFGGITAYNGGQ
uniref:Gamma-gliadin n=1 Tax=Triticum monococcum TaxID=4568 RepID=I7G262_TRIMO|nr:gamma-gliadin [Triticum monococcum]